MNQLTRVHDVRPSSAPPGRSGEPGAREPGASHSSDRSMLALQYALAVAAAVSAVLLSLAR